jgi:guanylate kinase
VTTLQLPDQDTGDAFLGELRARPPGPPDRHLRPSGVGKDSVIDQLRPVLPDVHFAVTATTRPRRPNEIEGVHYYFLDREEFLARQADGEFLESAVVYDNMYGVPRTPISRAIERGQDVVVKVDVQGSATIRQLSPVGTFIFLAPESMPELYRRLSGRKTDDPDAVMRPLQ